jgi:microcystin-dependent protein
MATVNFGVTGGIEVSDDAVPSGYELVPVGTIILYAGSTEPEGWLFCDGRSIEKSNATYINLKTFLELNSYPFGSDASNFNIPNFQSRIPDGYSANSVGG